MIAKPESKQRSIVEGEVGPEGSSAAPVIDSRWLGEHKAKTPMHCLHHYRLQKEAPFLGKGVWAACSGPACTYALKILPFKNKADPRRLAALRELIVHDWVQQNAPVVCPRLFEAWECAPEKARYSPAIYLVTQRFAGNFDTVLYRQRKQVVQFWKTQKLDKALVSGAYVVTSAQLRYLVQLCLLLDRVGVLHTDMHMEQVLVAADGKSLVVSDYSHAGFIRKGTSHSVQMSSQKSEPGSDRPRVLLNHSDLAPIVRWQARAFNVPAGEIRDERARQSTNVLFLEMTLLANGTLVQWRDGEFVRDAPLTEYGRFTRFAEDLVPLADRQAWDGYRRDDVTLVLVGSQNDPQLGYLAWLDARDPLPADKTRHKAIDRVRLKMV